MFGLQLKRIVAVLCTAALSSCSFLGSHSQSMLIQANNPKARLYVNGDYVGEGSALVDVAKKEGTIVSAELGSKRDDVVLTRTLSGVGAMDAACGYIILLPLLGLASPGAYKFDREVVELNID